MDGNGHGNPGKSSSVMGSVNQIYMANCEDTLKTFLRVDKDRSLDCCSVSNMRGPQLPWGNGSALPASRRGSTQVLHLDVGQNGRPLMGPQMWMSSLVLTIQLLGYLILTHTHVFPEEVPEVWDVSAPSCPFQRPWLHDGTSRGSSQHRTLWSWPGASTAWQPGWVGELCL